MASGLQDANFPTREARTMHLDVAQGEVANRILCVGDLGRADRLSQYFDDPTTKYINLSKRGFAVYTGRFRGVEVSIIGTGMGTPMTDFVVRECRHVITGRMAMVRFGTCGLLRESVSPGTVVCCTASRLVSRNYDAEEDCTLPYLISKKVQADTALTQAVKQRLSAVLGTVAEGVDITADSFYDSQGRTSTAFDDRNESLIAHIKEVEPDATNLQMETFKLLQLASVSKGSIVAAACAIGLMNRETGKVLGEAELKEKELLGGFAILSALASFSLD